MKHISILGSTGSIGTQTLEVIKLFPNHFNVVALSTNSNAALIIEQARTFQPELVHVSSHEAFLEVKSALSDMDIDILHGSEDLSALATHKKADIVMSAIVGFAGLQPTMDAIEAGKDIALANKETLVVAGDIVMQLATEKNVNIIPVDSEHSAIFQSMQGENYDRIRRLILTASGGPFRNTKIKQLNSVTLKDALKHPNWNMGNKITIDSATMMNKGLEVIEAYHLFKIPPFKIDVVIHPQSIIHSMVEFKDSSIKAQMGLPDMRVPIQYALTYPDRLKNTFPELNFEAFNQLTFERPDTEKFPALNIAYEAIRRGGNSPCSINAANEVAVGAFIDGKLKFTQIAAIVEKTMETTDFCVNPRLSELIETDREARTIAHELIAKL
ncbi:MAG: 1-deoxy-D-xylulose-5-phosphate reductoisomerase [Salinivirgaceae bacterium]|jgi:1-deoxy-D-xylulose-5-phosphate reductoisomerase|nr:1-deoxy-D-xylulose-5-phosphate reductoisomerase [Salinivirgaceae bacterium]